VVVPGAIDVLTELRRLGLRTAIVCDIGLTPSSALEDLLQSAGVLPLTDVQMWSDVREIYKPDPAIFRWTIEALGVEPEEAIHVGDRLRTDVEGARRVGMMSVRFNGVYDDQDDVPEADLVIDDLRDLVTVLGLAAG
jgi:putative hydrolase of the HAD superfamily